MKKKKKIVITIVIVLVLCIIAGVVYFYINRGGSVGIDSSIVNEDNKTALVDMKGQKVLVVYFSETGNTQRLAKIISDQVGGDFRRLEPVVEYPSGRDLYDYTEEERDNDERPEFKDSGVNPEDYDVVFVGYPMWWYTLPMIMYTFFDEYDFSGVTIVPFNTHEGSGDGGTYDTIKEFEPNATVLDGLPIRGGSMRSDQTDTVSEWLADLGYTN